jgi:hypothetical protein
MPSKRLQNGSDASCRSPRRAGKLRRVALPSRYTSLIAISLRFVHIHMTCSIEQRDITWGTVDDYGRELKLTPRKAWLRGLARRCTVLVPHILSLTLCPCHEAFLCSSTQYLKLRCEGCTVKGNLVSFPNRMPNDRRYVGSVRHHYYMVVIQMMIIGRSSSPEGLKQKASESLYETITVEQTMTHMKSCTDRQASESDSVPVPIHSLAVYA